MKTITPQKGLKIIDKFSGNNLEFLDTSKDTNGEFVRVKITLHHKCALLNKLLYNRQKIVSKTSNIGNDIPKTIIKTFTPALHIDFLLINFMGLMNDGKIKNGKIPFLQAVVMDKYLGASTFLPNLPIHKIMLGVLDPIARLFGYRALYAKYCGIEK